MSAPNATAGAWVDEADWLRFAESCLVTMLEASEDGFFVFDADGVCRMIGRKAGDLFDLEPASFVGKGRREVLEAVAKDADDGEAFLAAATKNDLFLEPGVHAERIGHPNRKIRKRTSKARPRTRFERCRWRRQHPLPRAVSHRAGVGWLRLSASRPAPRAPAYTAGRPARAKSRSRTW